MKTKLLVLFFFITLNINAQARQLSQQAEISVLTIGPGNGFVDSFGHSGFRVKDHNIDIVFDYGRYDFDAPNFILKFARGKLNYKLGFGYFSDFYNSYVRQNRTIQSQVLNLTQPQKQQLFDFLVENEKPENRYYLYDFFYDNCASIIRDVITEEVGHSIVFNAPNDFKQQTFRKLIRSHLNQNSWGSLGIDIALGSVIDKTATPEEHMFLPNYIHTFFKNATYKNSGESLVKTNTTLFKSIDKPTESTFITSPLMIFGILSLVILWITYRDYKTHKRTRTLDIILFITTGSIGIFILLLWFATDHTATAQNYNLLWAFALNLFILKQVWSKHPKNWFIKYLKFLVIALSLLVLHWIIGIQAFAIGLIPFLIALFIRYIYLIKHFSINNN